MSRIARRGALPLLLALLASTASVWLFIDAAFYLESPAKPPVKSDVAVILGGDSGYRVLKGAEIFAVVSDPFHMRRLDWIWARVFAGSGLRYSLVASSPEYWKPNGWWRDERSGGAVIMEYIKLAYYVAKY